MKKKKKKKKEKEKEEETSNPQCLLFRRKFLQAVKALSTVNGIILLQKTKNSGEFGFHAHGDVYKVKTQKTFAI